MWWVATGLKDHQDAVRTWGPQLPLTITVSPWGHPYFICDLFRPSPLKYPRNDWRIFSELSNLWMLCSLPSVSSAISCEYSARNKWSVNSMAFIVVLCGKNKLEFVPSVSKLHTPSSVGWFPLQLLYVFPVLMFHYINSICHRLCVMFDGPLLNMVRKIEDDPKLIATNLDILNPWQLIWIWCSINFFWITVATELF
jgi:hypothetical protein